MFLKLSGSNYFMVSKGMCLLTVSSLSFPFILLYFSDGETFISADDLRVNLWNLEISSQSFNIVDVKPANMEDLTGKNRKLLC